MLTHILNQEENPLKDDLKKEFVGVGRTFTEIWVLVHLVHYEGASYTEAAMIGCG